MIFGKIMRGKKPEDFLNLSENEDRKLVMVMGQDGLEKISKLRGQALLIAIGYQREYIHRLIDQGYYFKFIMFETSKDVIVCPANWPGVARMVLEVYPDTTLAWLKHFETLKTKVFTDWQESTDRPFALTDKAGKDNPSFITYPRFLDGQQTALDLRSFLYFTVRLTDLYSGDGFVRDENGRRTMKEFITANRPIAKLKRFVLVDLEIQ